MSATIIVEFLNYGGSVVQGALPQIPGEIVRITEYDSSTGRNHVLDTKTKFFGVYSDTDQYINFLTTDSAGDSLTSGQRLPIPADRWYYHAREDNNGENVYTQVNIKDQ